MAEASPYPPPPTIKDRLTGEKKNNVDNGYPTKIWDSKWVRFVWVKEKDRIWGFKWGGQFMQRWKEARCDSQNCSAQQISLSGEKVISGNKSLPGIGPHYNVNFPYKRSITTLVFRAFLGYAIPQINQLKISLCQKGLFWDGQFRYFHLEGKGVSP